MVYQVIGWHDKIAFHHLARQQHEPNLHFPFRASFFFRLFFPQPYFYQHSWIDYYSSLYHHRTVNQRSRKGVLHRDKQINIASFLSLLSMNAKYCITSTVPSSLFLAAFFRHSTLFFFRWHLWTLSPSLGVKNYFDFYSSFFSILILICHNTRPNKSSSNFWGRILLWQHIHSNNDVCYEFHNR